MIAVDRSRLHHILSHFAAQPILVVGDLMLDEFIWGSVERISPEAPVPVVEVVRETVHLGGAANVAVNLAVMGARPIPVGVIGSDGTGQRLLEELKKRAITTEGVVQEEGRITSQKTRIIAHHQQVCRADRETRKPVSEPVLRRLEELSREIMRQSHGVILSDYSKGVLTAGLIQALVARAEECGKFLAVDPKTRNFALYQRAAIITPNQKEAEEASGVEIFDEASLVHAGRTLRELTSSKHLLITRGEAGMTLFEDQQHFHIPTVAQEVFDVTGAGDTVIATLTLAVAAGASVGEAAILANHAAGVVVGKLGTASATVEEIRASIG